jgi:hypothetical protein
MDDIVRNQRLRDWGINLITDRMFGNTNRDAIYAKNAIIEDINRDNRTGYVTISYGVMDRNQTLNMQVVTLIVGRDTIIMNQYGEPVGFRELREGMTVDAEFSAVMTRSIPPQARAFRIIVIDSMQSAFTEGRVMEVDLVNRFLYTGNPFDVMSQMRFVITDSTTIRDRRGRRIRLRDLRPGELVRVEHAIFQTMSIPPQTTAFNIQVL